MDPPLTVIDTVMFYDYKSLSRVIIRNRTKATDGSVVNWLKVKWFKYEKQHPGKIFFKFDYADEYKVIDVQGRGRKTVNMPYLKKVYAEPPKISALKYTDLKSLCTERAIPGDYHPFMWD
jgi:hypothetical protein